MEYWQSSKLNIHKIVPFSCLNWILVGSNLSFVIWMEMELLVNLDFIEVFWAGFLGISDFSGISQENALIYYCFSIFEFYESIKIMNLDQYWEIAQNIQQISIKSQWKNSSNWNYKQNISICHAPFILPPKNIEKNRNRKLISQLKFKSSIFYALVNPFPYKKIKSISVLMHYNKFSSLFKIRLH